jgi:subtilisin family serine protease
MTKDADEGYDEAFREQLARDPQIAIHTEPGREFLYRPGQLLVSPRDLPRVTARLRDAGVDVRPGEPFGGVDRLIVDERTDLPALVSRLRDPSGWPAEQRLPAVAPHHVMVGFGNIMGNPKTGPVVAAGLPDPDPRRSKEGAGVTVGICDTGIWSKAAAFHPTWLGGGYGIEAGDDDPLYAHDDVLALQGGHGTFVAGVVRQAAPGVQFDPEVAYQQNGIGDEESLIHALEGLSNTVDIVNLSLGCYTQDNLAPLSMAHALAALDRQVVVVAAAGNAGSDRPSWPAAFKQVIAVAAVRPWHGVAEPTNYSNFGPWVDACAMGERVSTYVTGRWDLAGTAPFEFDGFARWAGTSFAAPYVAGRLAALMTSQGMTAAEARNYLLTQPIWQVGYGVLVD